MGREKKLKKVKQKEEPGKLVKGHLIGGKVVIKDDIQNALSYYDRGSFGQIHGAKDKQLELALVEALYLYERKKLKILDGKNKVIPFAQLLAKAQRSEANFWNRWRVYRDFRSRGYVLKTALKFGADFRVYRRGMKPGEDHAKWVLYCVSESQKESWREFSAKMRVAHSTRKTLLIGCVDDEGDATYWEVRWTKP